MGSSSPYEYTPLDQTSQSIRLLTIRGHDEGLISCEVNHFKLDAAPEYVALSYDWGPNDLTRQILLDGRRIDVRENMWDVLDIFATHGYPKELPTTIKHI